MSTPTDCRAVSTETLDNGQASLNYPRLDTIDPERGQLSGYKAWSIVEPSTLAQDFGASDLCGGRPPLPASQCANVWLSKVTWGRAVLGVDDVSTSILDRLQLRSSDRYGDD